MDEFIVEIDYTNWRGERRVRKVKPIAIVFGRNEWHPENQWLLVADDLDKSEARFFAMKDIHSWKPTP